MDSGEEIEHRSGSYFYIVNKATGGYLTLCPPRYGRQKPFFMQRQYDNIDQIWMVEEVKRNVYEIVHLKSTLVLEFMNGSFVLTFGKQYPTQLFTIERAAKDKNYFSFKVVSGGKYLNVSSNNFEDVCDDSIWILLSAEESICIKETVIIENAFTNLVLDVPEASKQEGVKIIQYIRNNRLNQRWLLLKFETGYHIQSANSELILGIEGEAKDPGGSLIQLPMLGLGKMNQLWNISYRGKGLYMLRSLLNPRIFLGLKPNSKIDEAEIIMTDSEEYALWRIENMPSQEIQYV